MTSDLDTDILLEALRFYADLRNWRDIDTGIGIHSGDAVDYGAVARAAISKAKEKDISSISNLYVVISKLLEAIEIAMDCSEGNTFGIYHNSVMDTIDEAETLLAKHASSKEAEG